MHRPRRLLWSGASSKPERNIQSPVIRLIASASPVVMLSVKCGPNEGSVAANGLSSA